jgi:hypothetical protein
VPREYLKLPNGRALTGHSHDYKRNGTSTLFAAFEVATGKVTAAYKNRRRRERCRLQAARRKHTGEFERHDGGDQAVAV